MEVEEKFYATGKRKESIAKVWLERGEGNISVNKRDLKEYFRRDSLESNVKCDRSMLSSYTSRPSARSLLGPTIHSEDVCPSIRTSSM